MVDLSRLRPVADGVWVATSRLETTTSTVVAGGHRTALLIDPAWEPDELAALGDDLGRLGLTVAAGLATHAHYDHLLWHPMYGEVPRWASASTCDQAVADRVGGLAELGADWPADLADLYGQVQPIEAGRLPWNGPAVELIAHDAHLPGHLAAWLPQVGVLIAGDMLSDVEPPLLSDEPDALAAYREGLDRLAPYVEQASLIVPGHGTVGPDATVRLRRDRAYLDTIAPSTDPPTTA